MITIKCNTCGVYSHENECKYVYKYKSNNNTYLAFTCPKCYNRHLYKID